MDNQTSYEPVVGEVLIPVVRCRVCENRECEGRAGMIVCDITGESHPADWFCADGK